MGIRRPRTLVQHGELRPEFLTQGPGKPFPCGLRGQRLSKPGLLDDPSGLTGSRSARPAQVRGNNDRRQHKRSIRSLSA
jgi:hypothetical protein